MTETKQTILLIDGQNFIHRIRSILVRGGVKEPDLSQFDFWGLLNHIFRDVPVARATVYGAKIRTHPSATEKSHELIERSERIRKHLEAQGFQYITAGSVRGRRSGDDEVTFQEKGVDVRIAVDMVTAVTDRKADRIILASSDSDLQPAIYEVRHRGAKVVYLGFGYRPNHGLKLTTDQTTLIEQADVYRFYPETVALADTKPSRRRNRRRRG